VFLTALAIADDVGAVLVIALFYTEAIRVEPLVLGAAALALIAIVVRLGVRRPGVYVILGLIAWACVTASNLHPTVAGILVASLIPARSPKGEPSMALMLEEYFHPTVAFLILPVFALFNAGVVVPAGVAQALVRPVGLGIVLGLVLGKQAGILLFAWLSVKAGQAELPEGVTWMPIYGVACLAGLGFTMSLFITDLAFRDESLAAEAKLAILVASLLAAVWGAVVLHVKLPQVSAGIADNG
jgi:NhaA family Na+:H+ antiporter